MLQQKNHTLDMNVIKLGDVVGFSDRSWISAAINIGIYDYARQARNTEQARGVKLLAKAE